MNEQRDPQLWKQAKSRAGFKSHLTTYIIIIGVIWICWLAIMGIHAYPWPIWPTIGWGIGVILNYFSVFIFSNSTEKEYEKLKRQKE